jgi:hypothetical protein
MSLCLAAALERAFIPAKLQLSQSSQPEPCGCREAASVDALDRQDVADLIGSLTVD